MAANGDNELNPKDAIASFCNSRDICGFEAYVVTKEEPRLRKITLHDPVNQGEGELGFKKTIRNMLLDVLAQKYLAPDTEYTPASNAAENQRKMYIIPQTEGEYYPFGYLNSTPVDFKESDLSDAVGLAFEYRKGQNETLWLYQHLWAILVPNKKKTNLMARVTRMERGIIFYEQTEPLLTIAHKIDLVIVNGSIITENISLMQKSFGFQEFIMVTAQKTIQNVLDNGIIKNADKLNEYINRGNGKPRYAKKLMRITDSKVLKMTPAQLLDRIEKVDRWKGKFVLNEDKSAIDLQTYIHVEQLIDLLDERFTKSEITDTEYDTDVKKEAGPVQQGE